MIKVRDKVVSITPKESPVRGVVVAIEKSQVQLKRIQRCKDGDWVPLFPIDSTIDWFPTPPYTFRAEDYRE